MSSTNQLTFPLKSCLSQQGKRQREEFGGEPQAKRVRWADLQPESTQEDTLMTGLDNTNNDDEIVRNVVKVLVDNDKHQFFVRQDIICALSKLFRAMVPFAKGQEATENVVRLPSTSNNAFRTYLHWLKTRTVSLNIWFDRPGRTLELTESEGLQAYIDIYVLAENFDDRKLRNHVMRIFIKNCHYLRTIPGGEWCTGIWKQTSKGSLLRTFLVEWAFFRFAPYVKSAEFGDVALSYPEEFRKEFVNFAFDRGLPDSGNRPGKIAKRAFQDVMRARLLEKRSR
jgi:hypothetical protein